MSDFVEQCRREWKRLGVPAPLAEEMAADLASDLGDAAAEGVPAEELLGRSVHDPQSFAATWAAERGVIPAPTGRRRPRALVAFTALAATAVVVAAVLLLTGQPKVALVRSGVPKPARVPTPPGPAGRVLQTSAAAPVEWILLVVAIVALAFAAWLWSGRGRPRRPAAA